MSWPRWPPELYVADLGGMVQRIANACIPGRASDPTCPQLSLLAGVNQPEFAVGQTLAITAGLTDPGLPGAADFYLGVLMPEGTIAFFTSLEDVTFGNVADLGSFRPIAVGVPLAAGFSTGAGGTRVLRPWYR